MRIARQPLAVALLAEVEQLLFGHPPFEIGAGVDAGRAVALDVEQVTAVAFALGVPEVIEAGREHVRHRRKARNVPTEVAPVGRVQAVGLDDQGHGVPAHVGAQATFEFEVARAALLVLGLDRIDIAGRCRERAVDALLACVLEQLLEQEVTAFTPLGGDDR